LFGEIGWPDYVENISDSGSVRFTRARQSTTSFTAASDSGICRTPAAVFGVLNPDASPTRIRTALIERTAQRRVMFTEDLKPDADDTNHR
jgi:hypothetical protein